MDKYRNPILVKVVAAITIMLFFISSLSPGFMFSMLGITNMEPFVITAYQYCFSVGPAEISLNPEYEKRNIGIFSMFLLLIVFLILYLLFKLAKTAYARYIIPTNAMKEWKL